MQGEAARCRVQLQYMQSNDQLEKAVTTENNIRDRSIEVLICHTPIFPPFPNSDRSSFRWYAPQEVILLFSLVPTTVSLLLLLFLYHTMVTRSSVRAHPRSQTPSLKKHAFSHISRLEKGGEESRSLLVMQTLQKSTITNWFRIFTQQSHTS